MIFWQNPSIARMPRGGKPSLYPSLGVSLLLSSSTKYYSTCKSRPSCFASGFTHKAHSSLPASLQMRHSFTSAHLALPCPAPPLHLFFPLYPPASFTQMTVIIKPIQKQDTFGGSRRVPPFVKHLFCVAPVFVLLFIFTGQLQRENIPLLSQTKLYLESSNRLHMLLRKHILRRRGGMQALQKMRGKKWCQKAGARQGWPTAPAQQLRLGFTRTQM